jgi:putative transposase
MSVSLNDLYRIMGISKQAVHKHLNRCMSRLDMEGQTLLLASKIRCDHPQMALRDIYFKLRPTGMGRDRFEELCKSAGFGVKRSKNHRKTTDSSGVIRFDNLLKDLKVERMNQVWQSDITYFELCGRFCFITLIQDAYSKVIVGYSVSVGISTAETTLPALTMALKRNRGISMKGLIFHSDGGGQYYAGAFLNLTRANGIINSMCEHAWENGMAERLNGVVKNNYLRHRNIKSFKELQKEVDRTVKLYNREKPHSRLNKMSPMEFEKQLLALREQTKPKMRESLEAKQILGASSPLKSEQTKPLNQDVFRQIILEEK